MSEQTTNSIPGGEKKRFDFGKAVADGVAMNEIVGMLSASGMKPQFDDTATFSKKYPDIPINLYMSERDKYLSMEAAGVYKKQLEGVRFQPTQANIERGLPVSEAPKWNPLPGRTVGNVQGPYGNSIQLNSEDAQASGMDWFVDKKGRIVSSIYMDKLATNRVQWEPLPSGDGYYWRELKDGEMGTSNQLQGSFGDRELITNNLLGSFGRGLWSGSVPLVAKGTGAIMGWINQAYSDIANWDDFTSEGKIVKPENTWLSRTQTAWNNWGNANSAQNIDEQEGLFSNAANTLFQLGNAISQVAGTMIPAYGAGFTLTSLGVKNAAVISAVGQGLGIGLGAAESGAMMEDEMRKAGFDESSAQRWGAWFGVGTALSESIPWFRMPLIKSVQAGMKTGGAVNKKFIGEAYDAMSKGGPTKNATWRKAVMPDDLKGVKKLGWELKQWAKNPVTGQTLKDIGAASVFEGLEEVPVESTLHKIVAAVQTGVESQWALKYDEMTRDWTIEPNPDDGKPIDPETGRGGDIGLPYIIKDSKGHSKKISADEYADITSDMKRARGILDGTIKTDVSADWREGVLAGLATAITMGAGSGISHVVNRNNAKDAQNRFAAIGLNVALGNTKRESVLGVIDQLDTEDGYFGSHNITPSGKAFKEGDNNISQADFWKQNLVETIDFYTEVAKKYGLTNTSVLNALNYNASGQNADLAHQALTTAGSIEFMKQKVEEAKKNKVTTVNLSKQEMTQFDLGSFRDDATKEPRTNISVEDFETKIAEREAILQQYISPKGEFKEGKREPMVVNQDPNGVPQYAKYSEKYTEKYLESESAMIRLEKSIDEETLKKVGQRDDPKNKKLKSGAYDKIYKKEREKITSNLLGDPRNLGIRMWAIKWLDNRTSQYSFAPGNYVGTFNNMKNEYLESVQRMIDQRAEELRTASTMTEQDVNELNSKLTQAINDMENMVKTGMTAGPAYMSTGDNSFIKSNFGQVLSQINMMASILSDNIKRNQNLSQPAQELIKQNIVNAGGSMTRMMQDLAPAMKVFNELSDDPDISQDESSLFEGAKNLLGSFRQSAEKFSGATPGMDYERIQPIDKNNLTDEQKLEALKGIFFSKVDPDSGLTYGEMLQHFASIANTDQGVIDNTTLAQQLVDLFDIYYGNILSEYTDTNVDFMVNHVEANQDTREHSLLLKAPAARLNDNIRKEFKKWIDKELKEKILDPIQAKINVSNANRKIGDMRNMVNRMDVMRDYLDVLLDHFSKELGSAKKTVEDIIARLNKIFNGKYGNEDIKNMRELLSKYANLDPNNTNTRTEQEKIERLLLDYDAEIIRGLSELGGKLDEVENRIMKRIGAIDITNLTAFERELATVSAIDGTQGLFSREAFRNGLSVFLGAPNTTVDIDNQYRFFLEYFSTITHRANVAGQNGAPTMIQIYKMVNDVLSARSPEDPLITYEQLDSLVGLLGWYWNPSQEWLKKCASTPASHADLDQTIWDNTIMLRAYNSTGKTTVVFRAMMEAIMRAKKITTEKFKVSVVLPNQELQETYIKNQEILRGEDNSRFPGFEVEFLMASDVLAGKVKPSADTQLVVIEEASLYGGEDHITKLKKNTEGHLRMLVGDDGQTTSFLGGSGWYKLETVSEKTFPMTEPFRFDLVQVRTLLTWVRQQFMNAQKGKAVDLTTMPKGKWKHGSQSPGPIGLRVVTSKEQVLLDFKRFIGLVKGNDMYYPSEAGKAILIVPRNIDKELLLVREPDLIPFSNNIKTVEADFDAIMNGSIGAGSNISGIEADYVFVYDDYTQFKDSSSAEANALAKAKGITLIDVYEGQDADIRKMRHMLTAASRMRRFLVLANPEVSEETQPIESSLDDTKIEGWNSEKQSPSLDRVTFMKDLLTKISEGAISYGDETTGGTSPVSSQVDYTEMTPAEQKTVSKEKGVRDFFGNFTEQAKTGNTQVTDLKGITDLLRVGQQEKSPENISALQKITSRITREVMLMVINPDRTNAQAIEAMKEYLTELKKAVQVNYDEADIPQMAERLVIKYVNHFFLSPELSKFKDNPLVSSGSFMHFEKVSGSPVLMHVVGYDTKLGKPIVDIIDFNYSHTDKLTDYSKAKMGTYAALAIANGAIVNRMSVHTLTINHRGKHIEPEFHQVFTLDDQERMQWVSFGQNLIGLQGNPGDFFATAEQMKMNARMLPSGTMGIVTGGTYINRENGLNEYVEGAEIDRNGKATVHLSTAAGGKITMPLDEFRAKYVFSSTRRYTPLWKSAAVSFHKDGKLPSTSHVFAFGHVIDEVPQLAGNVYTNAWLLGLHARIRDKAVTTMRLNKRLYRNTDNNGLGLIQVDANGEITNKSFNNWTFAVANELSYDQVKTLLAVDKVLARKLGELGEIKSMGIAKNNLVDKFRALGLHIISLDYEPEYEYGSTKHGSGGKIFSDPSSEWGKAATNYIETGDERIFAMLNQDGFKLGSQAILADEFGIQHPDVARLSNIELNTYRLKAIRQLYVNGVDEQVSWSISDPRLIYNNPETPTSMPDFIEKIEKKGYKIERDVAGNVLLEQEYTNFGNRIRWFINVTPTGSRQKVRVYFDGARIGADLPQVLSQLMDGFVPTSNNAGDPLPIEKIFDDLGEELAKVMESAPSPQRKVARSEAIMNIRLAFDNLPMVQFFRQNASVFQKMMNSDESFKRYADMYLTVISKSSGAELSPKGLQYITRLNSLKHFYEGLKSYIQVDGSLKITPSGNPFYLFRSPFEKSRNIVEQGNLVTIVSDISQPTIITSKMVSIPVNHPSDELFMRRGRLQSDDVHLSGIENVRSEVLRIIGEHFSDSVHFRSEKEMRETFNADIWGNMRQAVITLTKFGSGQYANILAGRHEAFHFVLRYLLKPEVEEHVLEVIREKMVEEGLADNVDDVNFTDAHEYGANLFMRRSYKKSTFLGKVLEGIRRFLNYIGIINGNLDYWMNRIDSGAFASGNIVQDPVEGTTDLFMHKNWKYSTPQMLGNLDETFGYEQWLSVIHSHVAPELMKHSVFSRDFRYAGEDGNREMITRTRNYFKKFREKDNVGEQDIEITKYINSDEGETETVLTKMKVREMRAAQYLAALTNLTPSNKEAADLYIKYHLGDESRLYPLIQQVFKTHDINKVLEGFKEPKIAGRSAYSLDSDLISPESSQSQMFKLMFNTMPYWSYNHRRIIENKHVNGLLMDRLLILVFAKLRSSDKVINDESIFSELKTIINEYAGTNNEMVDTAYSFIREWGERATTDRKTEIVWDANHGKFLDDTGNDYTGRWDMVVSRDNFILASNMDPDDYDAKIEHYRDAFSAIKSHYQSRSSRLQAQFNAYIHDKKVWLEFDINTNSDKVIFTSAIRRALNNSLYLAQGGRLNNEKAIQLMPGPEQIYDYSHMDSAVYKIQNGERVMLLGLGDSKSGNYTGSSAAMAEIMRFIGVRGLDEEIFQALKKDVRQSAVKNILGIVLTMKLNAMLQSVYAKIKEDMDQEGFQSGNFKMLNYIEKSNYPDAEVIRKMITDLKEVYAAFNHDISTLNQIENMRVRDLQKDEYYPVVTDMFRFFENLAQSYYYTKGTTASRVVRGVLGTTKYEYPLGSLFMQLFPGKTDADSRLPVTILNRIDEALKTDPKDGRNLSPIFTMRGADEKNLGTLQYNCPVLNRKISIDNIYVLDGIVGMNQAAEYQTMSVSDKLKGIFEAITFADQLASNRTAPGLTAMIDTLADKKAKYLTIINALNNNKKESFYVIERNKRKVAVSVAMKQDVLGDIFVDFINYYDALRTSTQEKYNTGNFFNLIKKQDYLIDENGNYTPGNAIVQPGNPYNSVMVDMGKYREALAEYQAASTSKSMKHKAEAQKKLTDIQKDIYREVKKAHQKYYDQFVQLMIDSEYHMPDHIARTFGNWIVDGKSLDQWRIETAEEITNGQEETGGNLSEISAKDLWGSYYEKVKKATQEMKEQKFQMEENGEILWHPILEAAYWGHHIFNETVSHLTRGSEYNYENLIDYVKRGSGLSIEGINYNNDERTGIQPKMRVMIVKDIVAKDPYFGKNSKLYDGAVFLNPLTAYEYSKSLGGVMGITGDGPQKNVYFDYDPVTNTGAYIKMNHFPISAFDYQNNPELQQMVHLMLGPTLTKFYTHAIEEVKHANGESVLVNGVPQVKIHNYLMEDYDRAIRTIYRKFHNNDWEDSLIKKDENGELMYDIVIDQNGFEREVPVLNTLTGKPLREEMIDWVAFESAVKYGIRRSNELFGAAEGTKSILQQSIDGETDINSINDDNNVLSFRTDNLRLQTITAQGTEARSKAYPTQIANILGILDHNKPYGMKIQSAIAEFVEEAAAKLDSMNMGQLREMLAERGRDFIHERNAGGLIAEILADKNMVPDIVKTKQVIELVNHFNDYIKPDMPGQTYIQEPSGHQLFEVPDSEGHIMLYAWQSLNDRQREAVLTDPTTYKRRKIKAAKYAIDGSDEGYTLDEIREQIKKDPSKVAYRPAEVIMAFQHATEFGLKREDTLSRVMTYQAGGKTFHLYEDWNDRWTLAKYREFFADRLKELNTNDADMILAGFHKSVSKFIRKSIEGTPNAQTIMDAAASYYYNLNLALDVFYTRIPTTNASSGGMGRIVAFAFDKQNSFMINPWKNNIDGSDFDSDPMQVYFRTFSNGKIVVDKSQSDDRLDSVRNDMFNAFEQYYHDRLNLEMITSAIDLSELRKLRDKTNKDNLRSSTIGTGLALDNINNTSKSMVGYMANIENFVGKLLSLNYNERARLAKDGKIDPSLSLLTDKGQQQYVPQAISLVANLINAATDSAKEGGLLADLNIDFGMTNIIVGILLHGSSDGNFTKEIFDVLLSNDEKLKVVIKKILDKNMANRGSDRFPVRIYKVIQGMIGNKDMKEYQDILRSLQKFAYAGQQVRNFGYIARIQSGELPVNITDLTMLKEQVEYALGSSLEEFVELSKAPDSPEFTQRYTIQQQVNYVKSNSSKLLVQENTRVSHERAIRTNFNIPQIVAMQPNLRAMVVALDASFRAINRTFFMEGIRDTQKNISLLMSEILKLSDPDRAKFKTSEQYTAFEKMQRQTLIGTFLTDNFKSVVLPCVNYKGEFSTRNFDLGKNQDRFWLVTMFPEFLNHLKDTYSHNAFVNRLTTISGNQEYPQVVFENSVYITPEQKTVYKQSFMELPMNIRRALYAYQLLTSGFEMHNGAYMDMMDKEIAIEYSKWQDSFSPNKFRANLSRYASDILVKGHRQFVQRVSSAERQNKYTYFKVSESRIFNQQVYKKQGSIYDIVNSPYPDWLNTFGAIEPNQTAEKIFYLKPEDMKIVRKYGSIDVMNKKKTLIGRTLTENDQVSNRHFVRPGDRVMLPDGSFAEVTQNMVQRNGEEEPSYNYVHLKSLNYPQKLSSAYSAAVLASMPNRGSGRLAGMFIQQAKKVFPNIQVREASSYETGGDIARFDTDGVLLINTERFAQDTPIHELAHPFLLIIRQSNPELYRQLVEEARRKLTDPVFGDIMRYYYRDLTDEDAFMMEVIANSIGQSTMEDMDFWIRNGKPVYRVQKSLWQRFWSNARRIISNLFGVKKQFTGNTISELGDFLYQAFTEGNLVSKITSDELATLQGGITYAARFEAGTLQNTEQLLSEITNSRNIETMNDNQKISWARQFIKKNGMKTPVWFAGTEEPFQELESDGAKARMLMLYNEYEKRRDNYGDTFVKWITESKTDLTKSAQYFGKNFFNNNPLFSDQSLRTFLRQIEYDQDTRYFSYNDLDKTEFRYLYDEALRMNNVIVGIKIVDGKNIVNIYMPDRRPADMQDPTSIRGNLLEGIFSNAAASVRGIDYNNSNQDIAAIGLGLITRNMILKSKSTDVMNVAYLHVSPEDNVTHMIDPVRMRRNFEALSTIPEFMKSIGNNTIKDLFNARNIRDANPDYLSMLISDYKRLSNDQVFEYGVSGFLNDFDHLTLQQKLNLMTTRLRKLLGDRTENQLNQFQGSELKEIELLIHAIRDTRFHSWIDGQQNEINGPNTIEKYFFDGNSIGNDYIQFIRQQTIMVSRKVVREMNEVKKNLNPAFEFFAKQNTGLDIYLRNASRSIFERIFATVNVEGQEHFSGFLLWTRDAAEDPLFAQQAMNKGLTDQELKHSRTIVEQIHNQMIDSFYHHKLVSGYVYKRDGKEYTREDAEQDMKKELSYKKGMIPIMHATAGELAGAGEILSALKQRVFQITNVFEMMDNIDQRDYNEIGPNKLENLFWQQFGYGRPGSNTEYGDQARLKKFLGIQLDFDTDGNAIWKKVVNDKGESVNNMVSRDLEAVVNYFLLTSKRTIAYEDEVLPVINGTKVYLMDQKTNERLANEFKTEEIVKYIDLFSDQAIRSKRRGITGPGNTDLDKMVNMAHSLISPYFLTLNLNVGMISALSNGMFAHIEALSRDIPKWFGAEGVPYYGSAELFEAVGRFATDFRLQGQMMHEYQVMNMSELDVASHRLNTVTKKNVFTDFTANIFNWSTDYFARAIVCTAQMLHDGSYAAHYLKEDGSMGYDPKKDKRYWNSDGTQTAEQVVMYKNAKKQQVDQGVIEEGEELKYAYDLQTMGTLKFLADKYVVGSFDNMVRAVVGSGTMGRAFALFKTWAFSRIANAFQDGHYLPAGGRWVPQKDENGEIIPKWEQIYVESYIRTTVNLAKSMMYGRGITYMKNMNETQKANVTKLMLNLLLSIGGIAIFNALVQGLGADDREKKKKPIPPYRAVRNIKYSLESLLVIPLLFEMMGEPFTAWNIIRNTLMDPFGKWRIALGKFPEPPQWKVFEEAIKGMEQIQQEKKEAQKKTVAERRQEELTEAGER